MALITKTKTWVDNENVLFSDLNADFDTLYNLVNGNLDNANIASGAAIAISKIATGITGAVVGTTDTQTLTGKTIVSPVNSVFPVTGTTPTLNLTTGNIFPIVLSGNTTFSVSNALAGQVFMVEATQGSGTTYTNTWFSGITWVTSGATAPAQTPVSNGVTTYDFRVITPTTFYGYLVGSN